MPVGMVAYAFSLLWVNFCQKSCNQTRDRVYPISKHQDDSWTYDALRINFTPTQIFTHAKFQDMSKI